MILPSLLPRRKSPTPTPDTDGAGTIQEVQEVQNMISASIESSCNISLDAKDLGATLEEMELQYPDTENYRPPIYILTEHGWKVPSHAEALAVTIPFQDPEEPLRVQFGMGLRDSNGQISPYVRTENDDICVAPSELMLVDSTSLESNPSMESDVGSSSNPRSISVRLPKATKKLVRHKTTKRSKNPSLPTSNTSSGTNSRKRKATEIPTASTPSTSTKARRRKTTEFKESDDESQAGCDRSFDNSDDDQSTLIGSSPEKSPPRKIRPPNSGGSSPMKPEASVAFTGYQCQMPGCCFTASSPQHIKHHYETFQHGRMTRQLAMRTREADG
ncbi:hypothetical protein BDY19DRAFT_939320 [Irpex rosettiformis]|uniref:Uncharacterized protein n=1 Tax=Irpex rosettiformis TaxID=378272 RepID=A0ACB8U7S1_9APHY|nr:hypothetical protein BDY19DRAFT_939320 [Irpex rosettiformis]